MRTNRRAHICICQPGTDKPSGYELSPTFLHILGWYGSRYEPYPKVFDCRCTCTAMYRWFLATFPAYLIRIHRCLYGVWPKPFSWSHYWVSECLCKKCQWNSKLKPVCFIFDTIKKQNTAWIWHTIDSIKIFKHFYGERWSWFWLWLEYSYETRFTMSTYLCIQYAQSFTLEHYFAGSLFETYINSDVTKGIF